MRICALLRDLMGRMCICAYGKEGFVCKQACSYVPMGKKALYANTPAHKRRRAFLIQRFRMRVLPFSRVPRCGAIPHAWR